MIFPVHIGAFGGVVTPSTNTYIDAALAYATANTITHPPIGYVNALHTMFNTIEAYNGGSLLTGADIFRVYAYDGVANEFATINLCRNAFHASIVNSPVFTAKKGVRPDGVNGYINSGYRPDLNAINLTTDNAMQFAYFAEITAANASFIAGGRGADANSVIGVAPARTTTVMDVPILTAGTLVRPTITAATTAGSRGSLTTVGGTVTPYKDGVALTDITGITDGGLPNTTLYEAGYNNNGSLIASNTGASLSCYYLGAADASGQQVLHDAFVQYLADIASL